MSELLTIGYEGTDIDSFFRALAAENVKTLIDVRELPLSRKKGFSKNRLREAAESKGIVYMHYRDLGDPKPGRDAAKAGNIRAFRRIFSDHLRSDRCQEAIEEVIPVIKASKSCLLCFESCHTTCHRTMVADEIQSKIDLAVRHLTVKATNENQKAGH